MITKLESIVPGIAGKMSVESYVGRAWPMLGQNRVRNLLKNRQIKLNSTRITEESFVTAGDRIVVYMDGVYDMSLQILYDDGFVMTFIKPYGLPTDKDSDEIGEDTVLSRLKRIHPEAALAHRLDVFTSGIMLAAVNQEAEAFLRNAFEEHLLQKRYFACAIGRMPHKKDTLTGFLIKNATDALVCVSDERKKGSLFIETSYTVVREEQHNGIPVSYLAVEIPTGRTHQIRAHLAHIGHPLLGDDKYGDRAVNKRLKVQRPVLKSKMIRFDNDIRLGKYAGAEFDLPEE